VPIVCSPDHYWSNCSTYSHPFQVTLPNPRTLSHKSSSFPELLNCRTHCHPLLSLNPTICHLLNLASTNLILSPFPLKLSLIFSVFPLLRLCYRPYGLSPSLLTRKKTVSNPWADNCILGVTLLMNEVVTASMVCERIPTSSRWCVSSAKLFK